MQQDELNFVSRRRLPGRGSDNHFVSAGRKRERRERGERERGERERGEREREREKRKLLNRTESSETRFRFSEP